MKLAKANFPKICNRTGVLKILCDRNVEEMWSEN